MIQRICVGEFRHLFFDVRKTICSTQSVICLAGPRRTKIPQLFANPVLVHRLPLIAPRVNRLIPRSSVGDCRMDRLRNRLRSRLSARSPIGNACRCCAMARWTPGMRPFITSKATKRIIICCWWMASRPRTKIATATLCRTVHRKSNTKSRRRADHGCICSSRRRSKTRGTPISRSARCYCVRNWPIWRSAFRSLLVDVQSLCVCYSLVLGQAQ